MNILTTPLQTIKPIRPVTAICKTVGDFIINENHKITNDNIEIKGKNAIVGAGANITKLTYMLAESQLSGLEWAAGMPGTVGGAIHGNAHAFGTKISDTVKSVEAINLKTLKISNFSKKQCHYDF